MNQARSLWTATIVGLLLFAGVACNRQAHRPAAQEAVVTTSPSEAPSTTTPSEMPPTEAPSGQGMGMMGKQGMKGEHGMMGGQHMMSMGTMSCCPCGLTGMGMMMGGNQNPATAAKMMHMQAEMMKANAEILEKYAQQMSEQK